MGGVLAGGVSLWAVSPRVVFPPAVFGGCPPPVVLSRVVATFLCLSCSLLSGVPAPGRPPGLQQLHIAKQSDAKRQKLWGRLTAKSHNSALHREYNEDLLVCV